MPGADLVVPIGADQQEIPHLRFDDQVLEQFKGSRVHPLQIVEEQRQRVFRSSERAQKPPEHRLETVLCVLRRKLGNGRLFANDELELRNEVNH